MKKIFVGKDKFALIDDKNADFLSKYHWRLSWNGYAISYQGTGKFAVLNFQSVS